MVGLNSSNLRQFAAETTTLTTNPNLMIYWRLESKDDMAGSAVTIKIEKLVNGTYTRSAKHSLPEPSELWAYHAFLLPMDATGTYRATGILTAGTKTVATCDFTVK